MTSRRAALLLSVTALAFLSVAQDAGARSRKSKKERAAAVAEANAAAAAPVPEERSDKGLEPSRGFDDGYSQPAIAPLVPVPEAGPSAPSAPPSTGSSPVKISGVLFDGPGNGEPEPEEAVRLTNTDQRNAADIGDFSLSDEFGPPRNPLVKRDHAANLAHLVVLPPGTKIPPGGEIWIANDGAAFRKLFGFAPDYQVADTLPGVPRLDTRRGWPTWNALRGAVSLHDGFGAVVDIVPYERAAPKDSLEKAGIPRGSWNGPSVVLFHSSPFGWTGQILTRDRDSLGRLLADTDSAADWDAGFSRTQLGRDPVHRVEYPGQSRLVLPVLDNEPAEITCASAPENGFAALEAALRAAKKQVLVRIYQFENDHIADLLVETKKRGVEVVVFAEGGPVGGLPDQERYIAERLRKEGIPFWFLAARPESGDRARYRFDHSKYLIVDGDLAIIATENFGYSGHPVDPSYGNRGWMIHIRSAAFAAQLKRVWDADFSVGRNFDLVETAEDPSDNWGLPYKHPPFQLRRAVVKGSYPARRPPLKVKGPVRLELVACPDNCLAEDRSIIGMINGAKESLFVTQNSIPLWWGKKDGGSPEETPNLPLAAVVAAARRGVRVRVLLDGTWYNTEMYDPRDNDDTVRWLNDLAQREKLDMEAKIINLASTHVEKIHAKGVVADGRRVFVGSINWTENSYKGNREVGVVVDSADAASYYASLFQRDWTNSRLYRVRVADGGGDLRVRPAPDAKKLRRAAAGELLEVMAENGGFLEVRLSENATGYLPATAAGEVVAIPEETPALLGRHARVRGRVKATHVGKGGVHLNFGVNWRADFSVFIPRAALGAFQAAGRTVPAEYEGREVEVRGKLYEQDGPALSIEAPDAISFVQ